jgi:hypothetical protein
MRKIILIIVALVIIVGFAHKSIDRIWALLRHDESTTKGYIIRNIEHQLSLSCVNGTLNLEGYLRNGGARELTRVDVLVRYAESKGGTTTVKRVDLGWFRQREQREIRQEIGNTDTDPPWFEIEVEGISFRR